MPTTHVGHLRSAIFFLSKEKWTNFPLREKRHGSAAPYDVRLSLLTMN
jgi:hypothetical protein